MLKKIRKYIYQKIFHRIHFEISFCEAQKLRLLRIYNLYSKYE